MAIAVAILGGVLAVGVSVQAVFVLGLVLPDLEGREFASLLEFSRRVPLNLLTVAVALLAAMRLRVQDMPPRTAAWTVLAISYAACAMRVIGQLAVGVYDRSTIVQGILDGIVTASVLALVFAFALWVTRGQQRARLVEREAILPAVESSDAAASLFQTEVRRRRAQGYDASVAIEERLDRARRVLSELEPSVSAQQRVLVREVANELDDLRRRDVVALESLVFPVGIEDGAVPALRAVIGRIPSTIDASLSVPPEDDVVVDRATAVLAVSVAEEAIGTALQYGRATRLRLSVRRRHKSIVINLVDNGAPVSDRRIASIEPIHRRIRQAGGHVHLEAATTGHTIKATIPIDDVRSR